MWVGGCSRKCNSKKCPQHRCHATKQAVSAAQAQCHEASSVRNAGAMPGRLSKQCPEHRRDATKQAASGTQARCREASSFHSTGAMPRSKQRPQHRCHATKRAVSSAQVQCHEASSVRTAGAMPPGCARASVAGGGVDVVGGVVIDPLVVLSL